MYHDDIDWTYASWDWGVVKLCREMELLANPIAALDPNRGRRGTTTQRTARTVKKNRTPAAGVYDAA